MHPARKPRGAESGPTPTRPPRRRPHPTGGGPPDFADDYLLYLLARASLQASRQFHQIVKARGLQVPEWRVLASIYATPRTVGDLADRTLLKQPTLTKIIDRLERNRWVERQADSGDGRRVKVAITSTAKRKTGVLMDLAREHERSVLAGYAPKEAAELKKTLQLLIERTN